MNMPSGGFERRAVRMEQGPDLTDNLHKGKITLPKTGLKLERVLFSTNASPPRLQKPNATII